MESGFTLLAALENPPLRQLAYAHNFLCDALILAGKPAAAIAPFERSYQLFVDLDDLYGIGLVQVGLCEALILLRRYGEAESAAQQSLDLSNQIGEQVNKAYALGVLGRVANARGQYAL